MTFTQTTQRINTNKLTLEKHGIQSRDLQEGN